MEVSQIIEYIDSRIRDLDSSLEELVEIGNEEQADENDARMDELARLKKFIQE